MTQENFACLSLLDSIEPGSVNLLNEMQENGISKEAATGLLYGQDFVGGGKPARAKEVAAAY